MSLYKFIILILCLWSPQIASAYGLKFYSTDRPIDQRTSYKVFDREHPDFKGYMDVEFDMALYPGAEIGSVVRIKTGDNSKIFNLFFDIRGNDVLFRLNQEGSSVLISMPVNKIEMTKDHWFRVKIAFALKRHEITLRVYNKEMTCRGILLPDKLIPEIVFGKSDYIIDVPSVAIRQLKVSGEKTYTFSLNEAKGSEVHATDGKVYGRVQNPIWLINEAYHWHKDTSFASGQNAGNCFRPKTNEIYYFNRDTLYTYQTLTGEKNIRVYTNPCPVPLFLASGFIDESQNKLYVYEVYHEVPKTGPTIASLDLNTLTWKVESHEQMDMQLHHHASIFDERQGRNIIFGGFGNMHYSSKFYTLNTADKKWRELDSFSGDLICPRYFSTMGYLKDKHLLYIFGGMGNESGDQVVGRHYLNDLYRIDLNNRRIKKMWEIPVGDVNTVPARGMVMLNDSCFYILRYPESVSHSFLKLYRFSVKDGSYSILADSIPILSDKITTNAHLYYNERQSRLLVTVQESKNDISSTLTIYSLMFPPVTYEEFSGLNDSYNQSLLPYILAITAVIIITIIIGWSTRRHRKLHQKKEESFVISKVKEVEEPMMEMALSNSIYLFGDFSVFDRKKRNITYMFSPRIKQTFCLIMEYSQREGISSQLLSDLIWSGKSKDKVKNSRSVTINHLRKILSELDGIELIYEKGCFKLLFNQNVYCDYLFCMKIISEKTVKEYQKEFLDIISRGKFLQFFDDPMFDRFKHEVESQLESIIMKECEAAFTSREYQTVLCLTQAEFNIDPLNERALSFHLKTLSILKRENAAVTSYQRFISEYKQTTGEDYPHSFSYYWHKT